MAAFFLLMEVQGQDMQFSQSYSNPLFLNPAFAGSAKTQRVMMNYRKQWPGIGYDYTAYAVGTDFYLDKINGGVGVSVHRDVAGTHRLSNTIASLSYSQHLRLSRKSNLAVGLKSSFGQRAFDSGNLLFADMVIRESAVSLSQPQMIPATFYGDFSAGLLYYNEKAWLGVSMHHINEPNQSLLRGTELIPRKLSVHGGTVIPIESFEKSMGEKQLRVAFNYKSQGEWDQLDVGGYFTFRNINLGLWYRGLPMKPYKPSYTNHESVVLLLGYEMPKLFSFGYSYDISVNRLHGHSGGAHEIAMIIELRRAKKQKPRIVPCAKF